MPTSYLAACLAVRPSCDEIFTNDCCVPSFAERLLVVSEWYEDSVEKHMQSQQTNE